MRRRSGSLARAWRNRWFNARVGQGAAGRQVALQWLRAAHGAPPAAVSRRVHRDPREPWAERAPGVALLQLDHRGQERILRRVVGIVRVVQHRPRYPPHGSGVPIDQDAKCRPVAGLGAGHELGVGLR